ncbi:OmpA family protein [Labrys sp. KB_33_2]|uniref:OmpA family protein n=1 Tax=Labrys sp. KB_33_2 TaxID=3237479 RepID=UPI003F90BE00
MGGLSKYALVLGMMVAGTSNSSAEDPSYKRDIRDLKATILDLQGVPSDLKGLPSDLNNAVLDLSAKADRLAAQHSGLAVRQEEKTVTVSMKGDILFDFDKATIQPAAEPTLADIARLIASIPTGIVVVEGHTDSKGSARYNQGLSLQRANAVAKWLVKHGVEKARLSAKAFGDSRPIAANTLDNGTDNPDGRALNRRVEFVLPRL